MTLQLREKIRKGKTKSHLDYFIRTEEITLDRHSMEQKRSSI